MKTLLAVLTLAALAPLGATTADAQTSQCRPWCVHYGGGGTAAAERIAALPPTSNACGRLKVATFAWSTSFVCRRAQEAAGKVTTTADGDKRRDGWLGPAPVSLLGRRGVPR